MILLAASACGGSDTGITATVPLVDPPSISLSVLGDSAVPGAPLLVTVRGAHVTSTATGTLGGQALAFGAQSDSTLVGLTPDVVAGSQVLTVTVGGSAGHTTLSVHAVPAIADPASVITTAMDQALATTTAAPAPAGVSATDWQAHLADLRQMSAEAKSWLATASPAEQLASARLTAQVRSALGRMPVRSSTSLASSSGARSFAVLQAPTASCLVEAGFFLASITAYLASIAVVILAALAPGVSALLILPGLFFLAQSLPTLTPAGASLVTACGDQKVVAFAAQLVSGSVAPGALGVARSLTPSGITFERGTALRVYPTETVQPFDATQVSKAPEIAASSAAVDGLYDKVASLPAPVRKYFTQLPPHLSTLPVQAPVVRALAPAGVQVANVTGGVAIKATPDGAAILLEASSAAPGEIPFSFDAVSATDASIHQTYSATLLAPPIARIAVTPVTAKLTYGTPTTVTASLFDAQDRPLQGRVTWSSSMPGVATVDSTGTVTPVGYGSTTVTATAGGKSASATLTMDPLVVTLSAPQTTITGARSTSTANGVTSGTLSCSTPVVATAVGGGKGNWSGYNYALTSSVVNATHTDPLGGPFFAGAATLPGSFFVTASDKGNAKFAAFTVSISLTYTDAVTRASTTTNAVAITCQ